MKYFSGILACKVQDSGRTSNHKTKTRRMPAADRVQAHDHGTGKENVGQKSQKESQEAGMTIRSLTLVQAIFIALLLSLVPVTARSQEQQEPNVQKEKTADAPSQQKPAEMAPEQRQQGDVILPKQENHASADAKAEPKQEGESYTIKEGDTLWDISNAFLKDPFLWPFIWKANPSITNPDLIYPGNKLAIPSLAPIERAMKSQAEPEQKEQPVEKEPAKTEPKAAAGQPPAGAPLAAAGEEEHAAANKLMVPQETPVPMMDQYSMLSAGFVSPDESKDLIVGSKDGKTILGYDDIVYVTIHSNEDAAIGDKFIIYKPLNKVKHPITGKDYGSLVKVLGILQLTAKGAPGTYIARITLSFDAAEKGSMLTPYQEPTLTYNTAQAKPKEITGYLLEVMDGRTLNAQTDIVYLDKGSDDGVESGDRFVVYAKTQKETYPKNLIGEVQVFLVREHTSTAIVRKSTDFMDKGDEVEFKK
jgi:hypothetical protein